MTPAQIKMLRIIRDNPGLLWYEVGLIAYPDSGHVRINLFGKPFRSLEGAGLSATYRHISALRAAGAIRSDKEHRIYVNDVAIERDAKGGDA